MMAPSEKHLEDWIVANPDALPIVERIVSRQPRLPSGRPDLVAKFRGYVGPVEIKKGPINNAALIQCLRYIHDIEYIAMGIEIERHFEYGINDFCTYERIVGGMLIGSHLENDDLLVICELRGISLVTYEFDGEGYALTLQINPLQNRSGAYDEWSRGAIGDALRKTVNEWAEIRNKHKGAFDE